MTSYPSTSMRAVACAAWLSLSVSAAVANPAVAAPERESLESLRQTTLALIQALVDKGVLTAEAAQAMRLQAQQQAQQPTPAQPSAGQPAAPGTAAVPVQRVPYIPDSVKAQIRTEVREEVLSQARAERWGMPGIVPPWVSRLQIDGDVRFRHQSDSLDAGNTPASNYVSAVLDQSPAVTRALSYASVSNGFPTETTTEGRDRERLRMRLGVTARVSDEVGVGIRLATGSATDRVSTNQTLGQNFNKYQLMVDRAFIRLTPLAGLNQPYGLDLSFGRIPNPWFSTDMVWSENLNFEGAAVSGRWTNADDTFEPFATVGAFPLRERRAPVQRERWLYGAQVGARFNLSPLSRFKVGLAYYEYQNIEGREEEDWLVSGTDFVAGPSYGQTAYGDALRQKGNTLYEISAAPVGVSDYPVLFGLAHRFKPLVLTASAQFDHFSPFNLLATAEYVRNTAFSQTDFRARAGSRFDGVDAGGRRDGYHVKLAVGHLDVREAGEWQLSLGYKHLGSDAVLDAFTDSDLGLGGTNIKGYILGLNLGLARNTTLGVRYLSASNIDSTINDTNPGQLGVNTLQVELNVRF
ncbi:putative porin [Aquabacterium lacunae]|nr:putative porin [Aquabacterium lacunae]